MPQMIMQLNLNKSNGPTEKLEMQKNSSYPSRAQLQL